MIHRGLRPLKLSRSLVSFATGCMKRNMAAELRHHLRSGRLIITGSIERIRKVCWKFDDLWVFRYVQFVCLPWRDLGFQWFSLFYQSEAIVRFSLDSTQKGWLFPLCVVREYLLCWCARPIHRLVTTRCQTQCSMFASNL